MQSKMLGDYRIIKQIGQGALGSVYLAEHRFMKKQYALKVLLSELSQDRVFIQRFEEDVSLLTNLVHPNIVKVHNVSFAEGHYFLVTDCIVDEYGETTNIHQYLLGRDQPLKEEEIYDLLFQVADALDYAHQLIGGPKGVVHRGVKLNNILVSSGSKGVRLFLSDFGLTKIIGIGAVLTKTFRAVGEALSVKNPPSSGDDCTVSMSVNGSFLQNFAFLAPEQKRLDSQFPVDYKADVYAFGVLAYYLLMQQFPEGYFPMPSQNPLYTGWNWDSLIKGCLALDPGQRHRSLVEALEAVKTQQKIIIPNSGVAPLIPNPVAETIIENTCAKQQVIAKSEPETEHEPEPEPVPACVRTPERSEGEIISKLRPVIQVRMLERPEVDHDPAKALEVDSTVKQYVPEKSEIKVIEPLLNEMIVIDGGMYWRGSLDGNRDEMPRHQVILDSFAMDIHPVTNEQFVRFLQAMGGEKDSHHRDIIRLRDSRIKRSGGKLFIESGYLKHPVVGVTWYGAVAYAKWIGKRLPTEAEWEVAASGGLQNALYPTGDDIEKSEANFFSSDTTAVMSYPAGLLGIFDMAGNVYEWCQDWYGYNSYEISMQEPDNPKGPLQGVYRVLRGGCWKSLKEDLRCSRRHRNNPGTVNGTYGFRCAADVTQD